MRNKQLFLLLPVLYVVAFGCTTVIDAKLDTGPIQLSVDGIVTDQPGPQTIRLTNTAAYFDNSTPPAATSATVTVSDDTGKTYAFTDPDNDGYYVWQPSGKDTLGRVGRIYSLSITYQGETYRASSKMNRVAPVDSIIFAKKKRNPFSKIEGYRSEFYATDLAGATDYYRIQFYQNGVLQNKPNNIVTTQDGAFRGNANTDGLLFIQPIRRSANPDSLFVLNDVVKISVESLPVEAFDFWQQLRTQLSNGGLFATPPANLPTNILNTNATGRKATGFFIASAMRSRTVRVAAENIRNQID